MTLYRTGSIAGTQGPTIAVMAGKHQRAGFTDKFLTKHGMAEGSTIIMTPTGFVTEEGDSSHCNQAYDKFIALCDKLLKREALALLRSSVHHKVIDQWGLLHVCLYIAHGTKAETWTASFRACNMDPRTVISFPEWCKKIAPILAAGQNFKSETPVDMYALLPGWWHGALPEKKRKLLE
jgi:hypothetical protein